MGFGSPNGYVTRFWGFKCDILFCAKIETQIAVKNIIMLDLITKKFKIVTKKILYLLKVS